MSGQGVDPCLMRASFDRLVDQRGIRENAGRHHPFCGCGVGPVLPQAAVVDLTVLHLEPLPVRALEALERRARAKAFAGIGSLRLSRNHHPNVMPCHLRHPPNSDCCCAGHQTGSRFAVSHSRSIPPL